MSQSRRTLARVIAAVRRARKSALARSGVGFGGISVGEMAFGLLTAMLLARELGAEGLGIYALALATVSIAGLPVSTGLPGLVTREVAHATAKADEEAAKGVICFAVVIIAVASVAIVPLAFVVSRMPQLGLTQAERAIVPFALLVIPASALGKSFGAALAGRQRVVLGAIPQRIVRPGFFALALGVLAVLEPGWLTPLRAIVLQLVASTISLGVCAALFLRHFGSTLRDASIRIPWRVWMTASLRLGFVRGLAEGQPQLLLLLTGMLASLEETGLLRVAERGAGLVVAASGVPVTVAAPRFASLCAKDERVRLQQLVTLVARCACALSAAGLLGYLLAGGLLLASLFGSAFVAAWGALIVLTAGHASRTYFGPGMALLNMLRREDLTMRALMLSFTLSLAAALLLIPRFGALGAALGVFAGSVTLGLFLRYRACRDLGIDPIASARLA